MLIKQIAHRTVDYNSKVINNCKLTWPSNFANMFTSPVQQYPKCCSSMQLLATTAIFYEDSPAKVWCTLWHSWFFWEVLDKVSISLCLFCMFLSAAILFKRHFKHVKSHQEGISLSNLYLNVNDCSLFMILLTTKPMLLGQDIINFCCTFEQRTDAAFKVKNPLHFQYYIRKKKLNLQLQANSVYDQKEKNYSCAGDLSGQVEAEAYWLFLVFCSPTSAPERLL